MTVSAKKLEGQFRIVGDWGDTEWANAFLRHLDTRAFSPSTIRSYAFDIVNLARFLIATGSRLVEVSPMMVFEWIEWQGVRSRGTTDGSEAALDGWGDGGSVDNQPTGRGSKGLVRILGDGRRLPRQSCPVTAAARQPWCLNSRPAGASGCRTFTRWWTAGASTPNFAGIVARDRRRPFPELTGNAPRSRDRVGDAAG